MWLAINNWRKLKTKHLFVSQFQNAIEKRHIFIGRLVVKIFTFHNAALKRNES